MTPPSLSFILGLLVLAYLSTFILFAILRIVTGISIQRLGLSSIRRISYSPRDGLRIDIRGLGLQLHRPTYSQPTWISLVISELKVSADLERLQARKEADTFNHANGASSNGAPKTPVKDKKPKTVSKTWQKLTDLKEGLKRLQRVIPWFRYVDIHAVKSSLCLANVGTVHVGSLLLAVDTRRHAIDRSRLFLYVRSKTRHQQPAEWNVAVRGLLFEPAGKESVEIMDHGNVNIHGFLDPDLEGLRDASVFVKLGRVNIPVHQLLEASAQFKHRSASSTRSPTTPIPIIKEPMTPGTPTTPDTVDAADAKTIGVLSEAKGFVGSVLRGIKEVSFAISMLGISQKLEHVQPAGKPLYVSLSLKEMGLDLYRLEPHTPAHSMYFSRTDIAHQALLSAISMSVGIDDGVQNPERLIYVPMTTATVRTTLPSKLLQFAARDDQSDRNTNMFYANLVITSPSVDLNPQHLPLLIAAAHSKSGSRTPVHQRGQRFFSRFLPKMSVKLSIQEPVVRVALPPMESVDIKKHPDYFDFDLLIISASTLSWDIDSSHAAEAGARYYLSSDLRAQSYRMYYRSASKVRHDILINESVTIKTELYATPDVHLFVSSNFKTISIFLVRPEITKGIHQIIKQIQTESDSEKTQKSKKKSPQNFLRKLPPWLQHLEFEVSDLNIELAGIDKALSDSQRGVAFHLETWTAEYRASNNEGAKAPATIRKGLMKRSLSRPATDSEHQPYSPLGTGRTAEDKTDGRRVSTHILGLEAFVIEAANAWEDEPFISLPRAEMAISASNDGHGPVMHAQILVKSLFLQYSLFRYYCFAVAVVMLQMTFRSQSAEKTASSAAGDTPPNASSVPSKQSEFVVVDAKVKFVQLKARLPGDPPLMLHLHDLEAKRHRYLHPSVKAHIARLYAESPVVRKTWNRIVSVKNARIDLREGKKKDHHGPSKAERSFDFVSDAIRIGVPHQLVVHHIFDNIVNTLKATKQLHHRFKTRSEEYILAKEPEGPKDVPKVTVRTRVLLFEIEDGAFEWKLGVIFRTGLVEQKQRLAREEAFRLKAKNVESASKTPSGHSRRSKSRGRGRPAAQDDDGLEEAESSSRRSMSRSERQASKFNLRYDKEGKCGFSNDHHASVDDAWDRLQKFNAQSWKKRVDRSLNYQHGQVSELRSLIWGMDSIPDDAETNETILAIPQRPALMSIIISDCNIHIDKPSFPLDRLPDFMNKIGKGLPKDQEFALLIPLNARFEMGECRMTLRDYPLPLLHIPAIKPGQSPRLPSWSLTTDFIIGEEFRGEESTRDIKVMVIPEGKLRPGQKGGFAVDVRRTVAPVKTYSEIKFDINTARDTRITWGASYQAAIQDMMQVIEGFTKPQIDPSERVGFWDKIRLSFHSRVYVSWKGDGDVHLMLKGTRDPYVVTGFGAGLVMIWRNDVRWNIHASDDPTEFMTVDAGDYVLAIPDYSHYARQTQEMTAGQASGSSNSSNAWNGAFLKKVIMKLSGKVRWQAGIVFERNLENGQRTTKFEPHYNVTLRNPAHVPELQHKPKSYDAFRGFRSHQLHCSIAITAPADRDWTQTDSSAAGNYNSVHLSPRFFTHFFAWWSMFSGAMSLPTHQGPLFPGIEKSGKKFGRHIATIKYSLLLSPLFLSHIYKHKEAEEYASADDEVAATGLKVRLSNFILDLHQRREEFVSQVKGLNKEVKTSGMRINQALLDLVEADIRAVSASITGTSQNSIRKASASKLAEFQQPSRAADLSAFNIPDNDFSWIDIDDFVEVDWTLPENSDPQTDILPLAFAPRLTYRRQTDHNFTIKGDDHRESTFGYEPTHKCYIPRKVNTREVQLRFVHMRLEKIIHLIGEHARTVADFELKAVRAQDGKTELEDRLNELRKHTEILDAKKMFLENLAADMQAHLNDGDSDAVLEAYSSINDPDPWSGTLNAEVGSAGANLVDPSALGSHVSEFNNRFVVHHPMIKWTNSLRNIMLRYFHQVSQRRGFVYYTSRRAVKFILDIVEEQQAKSDSASAQPMDSDSHRPSVTLETPGSVENPDEVQDRIQQLLDDANKFVNADDAAPTALNRSKSAADKADQQLGEGFVPQNSYHVRLVGPQIQLQSLKNTNAAVLLTARGITFKVYSIMDKDRINDKVSGLVQRRFFADLENTQFFVTEKQAFSTEFLHMYSALDYGTSAVSSWPPWVPLEVMYDFDLGSFGSHGFSQVVQRTSASLRYDQYNKLRLKYNDSLTDDNRKPVTRETSLENAMDHIWIDFPRLRALCDSSQYFAMFLIAHDLLMYTEPLEKTRNERLDKIMLASDFSDLRGAPEMVVSLQERIRRLEEIKTHFHIHEQYLDRKGWEDRIHMDQDLASCENELFFMMKAITTSQRRNDDRTQGNQVNGLQRIFLSSKEIVWHLTKEANEPLAEFQLNNASFERTNNSDGSNLNTIEIGRIHGLNLLSKALYPHILQAYTPAISGDDYKMLHVNWHMLEAIGGIPVCDTFEVNLAPLQLQLEYDTGKQLFEYVFPGKGGSHEGQSPFMVKHQPDLPEQDQDEVKAKMKARVQSVRAVATDPSFGKNAPGSATGAGTLEHRLTPTHRLPDAKKPSPRPSSEGQRPKSGLGINLGDYSFKKMFHSSTPTAASVTGEVPTKSLASKASSESMSYTARGRSSLTQMNDGDSASFDNSTPTLDKEASGQSSKKRTRFSIQRSGSQESHKSKAKSILENRKKSDDLSQMLNRASNYMTLAYVKLPTVVLCLSYKGKGSRNIEDVDDLVFQMPTVEYRNKTWSNLDLAMALKKDVIKTLINHTGTILGNKLSHHRPGKTQQSRLRELASTAAIMSSSTLDASKVPSSPRSLYGNSNHGHGRPSTSNTDGTGTQFGHSPRVSDLSEEERTRYQSGAGGSYASSLAPHPENPEDDSDDDSDAYEEAHAGDAGLDPHDHDHGGRAFSSHSQVPSSEDGTSEGGVRSTLSRHVSDLTKRASRLTSNNNNLGVPGQNGESGGSRSRKSSLMNPAASTSEPHEGEGWDAKSIRSARSAGTNGTPKRGNTLKNILKKATQSKNTS